MLKLKLQYSWPPDAKRWLIEKDLDAKIKGRREREWQRMCCLDSNTESMDVNMSNFWEIVKDSEA